MLHQPEAHVVILPAPAPEIHTIAIDSLKLFSCENANATKKFLLGAQHGVRQQHVFAGAGNRQTNTA